MKQHKEKKRTRPANAGTPHPGRMMIRGCGAGEAVRYPGSYHSAEKIRWVSCERTQAGLPAYIRNPEETSRIYPTSRGFTAAGKKYSVLGELMVRPDTRCGYHRDAYGREVLYLSKPFPCFDCYDAIHENRHYHWFFLRENNALTRIYYADESPFIYVTEDAESIEDFCWEEMTRLGYVIDPAIQRQEVLP